MQALLCVLLIASASGLIFSNYPVYDYIVVGGGGAGSLFASRLTESGRHSVLVLEQGPNSTCEACDNSILSNVDDLYTAHGSSLFTTPQGPAGRGLKQVKLSWPGGNTRVYQGVAYPAHPKVYDQYPGNLTYETFLPYYAKFQNHYCNYLDQSVTGISPANCSKYHGNSTGPMGVGRPVTSLSDFEFFRDLVSAAPDLGLTHIEDAWNGQDVLTSDKLIFMQQHFRRVQNPTDPDSPRVRESTYSGYTPSSVRSRKNLTYKTEAQALRLVFRNEVNRGDFGSLFLRGFPTTNDPSTQAVGVTYQQGDKSYTVFARRQLVLAGGVLGTPKILQQSGVGPSSLLRSLNIPVVADNAHVGQNVAEHPGFAVVYKAKKQLPYNLLNFGGTGTILMTTPFARHGYPDVQIQLFPTFPVTSFQSQTGTSPLQFAYPPTPVAGDTTSLGGAPILNFIISRTDPAVRGTFNITGTQYRFNSQLDLGWSNDFTTYASSEDYQAQQWTVKELRKMLLNTTTTFSEEWIDTELVPGITTDPAAQDQNDLMSNIFGADLTYHQTGGCNLGKATDLNGAVLGISGVTVCDNSLQPHPPNQNPTGPMLALCEYVSEKLIQGTSGGPTFDDLFVLASNATDNETTPTSSSSGASSIGLAVGITIIAIMFSV